MVEQTSNPGIEESGFSETFKNVKQQTGTISENTIIEQSSVVTDISSPLFYKFYFLYFQVSDSDQATHNQNLD